MTTASSDYAHKYRMNVVHEAWLYHRFNLSHRDIEDLIAERAMIVSHEFIRTWCIKFGPLFAKRLRKKHGSYGDTLYLDEVFVKINGVQKYLWRAVD